MEDSMRRITFLLIGLVSLSLVALAAQNTATGNRTTPLVELTDPGNVGVSNAVLRDQPDVRVGHVFVASGGARVIHSHDDVKFHLFIPMTGPMTLDLEGGQSVEVLPWEPYYMEAGTRHGFHNILASPVDILEVFVR